MSFSFWEEEGYPKHTANTEQLKSFGEGVHRGRLYSLVCLLPGTEEGSIFSKEPVIQSCLQPSAGGQEHFKSHPHKVAELLLGAVLGLHLLR